MAGACEMLSGVAASFWLQVLLGRSNGLRHLTGDVYDFASPMSPYRHILPMDAKNWDRTTR